MIEYIILYHAYADLTILEILFVIVLIQKKVAGIVILIKK